MQINGKTPKIAVKELGSLELCELERLSRKELDKRFNKESMIIIKRGAEDVKENN